MEQTSTEAPEDLLMEQLQNHDWEQFWLRLMARCYWVLRRRYGIKWHNDQLKEFSRGIVSDVISKVFIEKKRKWNIIRYPVFEDFIVGAIDSHINNTLNKKNKEGIGGQHKYPIDTDSDSLEGVQEILISDDLRNQIYDELEKSGADDNELLIFECLAEGIEKPIDIRTELGMTEQEFHNAWRRFKRRRALLQEKISANGY